MAYRDGEQLDAEDAAAQQAAGIRRGQIIQTHDEIQRAMAAMQEKGGATPPPLPDQGAGESDAIAQAMKEVDAASWMRAGGERGPVGGEGKRRAGYPIMAGPGEAAPEPGAAVGAGVDAIGAARAAGGVGGAGAMLAGATGAGAVLLAQQALAMMKPPEQSISMPGSAGEGGGGPMAVQGEETDLKDLLDIQKQVARVGLPIKGGPPTTPGGSIL